jgi:DNA-3-methyladenine glycosylase I
MSFPYKNVFEQVEKSLIKYGSRHLPKPQIRAALDAYKAFERQELTDDLGFSKLLEAVFYSGFRAETVTMRWATIARWFPNWQTVAAYDAEDVTRIMSDLGMIRNARKINACIKNARMMEKLILQYGSFPRYVSSFAPRDSFLNLLLLKEELEGRFEYLGGVMVYQFLTDLGMQVLKPDRVICRMFHRLGLIEAETQILKTVLQGQKFAEATGLPIRYIDIVLVAYGQVRSSNFGVDRGICIKDPRCQECRLQENCRWYQTSAASGASAASTVAIE